MCEHILDLIPEIPAATSRHTITDSSGRRQRQSETHEQTDTNTGTDTAEGRKRAEEMGSVSIN